MNPRNKQTHLRSICVTAGFLALSTLLAFLLFYLNPHNPANAALIYILGLIFICRYTNGYLYGFFSSIFCVIFVNLFFTYPYFELDFTLTGYPITFLEMLGITLVTSTTTSHMMRQSKILAEKEKQLMEAEKEKMRANLLRAISHDIRTPLTSIMGTVTTLTDNDTSLSEEDRRELTSHIYDDAGWLLTMVENLLSITRIQDDSSKDVREKVKKSPEIIEEVVAEAIQRFKKRKPDACVEVTIPDEILMIPMDAMLIEQVITNLLENAVTHSHTQAPVSLSVTSESDSVTFCIRDYGVGIQENRLDTIFDGNSGYQSESSDSRRGMGIGLSICKTIILAHNGRISAQNHTGGAEFIFSLPKEDSHA